MTVRNAVDTLVNEGILRRVQGKGVFVVGDKYEENLDEHGGFVNVMSSGTKRVSIKEQAKHLLVHIYLQLPMAHYPKLFDVVHKRLNHLAQY